MSILGRAGFDESAVCVTLLVGGWTQICADSGKGEEKTTMMMVCYESQANMIYAPQWCIGRIQIQTLESLLSDIELLMAGCHIFVP